jgi:hypothetical protein
LYIVYIYWMVWWRLSSHIHAVQVKCYGEEFLTGFLIPIRAFTPHALAAVKFVISFGKRNRARFYFLFVGDQFMPDSIEKEGGFGQEKENCPVLKEIKDLIEEGKTMQGVHMETHFRSGDFIYEVKQFARDNHISEIIVSLPDESEETFEQTRKDILLLLKITHCRILTVKQKNKGLN